MNQSLFLETERERDQLILKVQDQDLEVIKKRIIKKNNLKMEINLLKLEKELMEIVNKIKIKHLLTNI